MVWQLLLGRIGRIDVIFTVLILPTTNGVCAQRVPVTHFWAAIRTKIGSAILMSQTDSCQQRTSQDHSPHALPTHPPASRRSVVFPCFALSQTRHVQSYPLHTHTHLVTPIKPLCQNHVSADACRTSFESHTGSMFHIRSSTRFFRFAKHERVLQPLCIGAAQTCMRLPACPNPVDTHWGCHGLWRDPALRGVDADFVDQGSHCEGAAAAYREEAPAGYYIWWSFEGLVHLLKV